MYQQTKTRQTGVVYAISCLISLALMLFPGILLSQDSSGGPTYTPSQVVPVTPPSNDPAEMAAREAADLAEAKATVEEYRQAVASGDNLKIRAAWQKMAVNPDATKYLENADPKLSAHYKMRANMEAINATQRAFEAQGDIRPYSQMEGEGFNRIQQEDPRFRQAPPDPATPGRGPDPGLADLVNNPRRRVPIQPPPEPAIPESTTKQLPPVGPPRSFDVGEGTVLQAPRVPPAPERGSGISAEGVAGGVIAVALTTEQIIKCKEAGLTSGQCAEKLVTMGAEIAGFSAALALAGKIPILATGGTLAVTALLTYKGFKDVTDTMYAGGSYLDAINNEKRVKQERAHQQELNAPSFDQQTAALRARIVANVGSVSDALKGACANLSGMAASAAAAGGDVQAALAGLPPAAEIAQVRAAAAACEASAEKKARLDSLRQRVDTYSSQVSAALQRLEAKAQACSTKEQAQALLDDWGACVGLSRGIGQMSAEARGLAGELSTVQQQAAQAKSICARAQSAADRVVALSGKAAGDSGRFEGEASRAEGLNNELLGRADAAQKEIINLRRAFAVSPERDAVFSELRNTVDRYQGGVCAVETYRRQFVSATAAAANARLDAQNRSAGISGEMAGLALCDGMVGDGTNTTLDAAEGDAGSSLIVNSDIPGRARECLARAGGQRDLAGSGFSSQGGENSDSSTQGSADSSGTDPSGGFGTRGGEDAASRGDEGSGPQSDRSSGGFASSGGENVVSRDDAAGSRGQGQAGASSGSGGGLDLLGTSISGSQPSPVPGGGADLLGAGISGAAPQVQGYPPTFETGPSPADLAAEQARQRNQQLLMESMQNFANQLGNMQRGSAPVPPLVGQAPAMPPVYTPSRPSTGPNYPYGQPAVRPPSGGTYPARGSVAAVQEPRPTDAEKQALTREIEQLYVSKWKAYWCKTSWSGCAIAPSGAKDALVSRAFYASKRSQLAAIRSTLYCWDPCIMGNLNDSARAACQKRCDQQFGY